jgi:predicted ester cyclase
LATPQGEVPATGRKLSLPLCDVFEVVAGRIVRIQAYYDQMAFATQLGLLPEGAPAT